MKDVFPSTLLASRRARIVPRISNLIFVAVLLLPALSAAQVTPPDFSIVLLPDTQNESQFYPQVLNSEIQWIVNNQGSMNIQAVLGLGDIVNDGADPAQQQNADAAIRLLDNAAIPYFLAIGNHDYDGANTGAATRSVTGFNQWWGPSRYAGKPYYLGNFPTGSNENFYGVVNINGQPFLILVLEWIPRTESLNWAASIVRANPDKQVIIVTHSYVFIDGTRTDVCDTEDVPRDNFGDDMWNTFVSKYSNIIMVVNGHFVTGQAARRADLGVNGNLVNQMFSNYQEDANGGDGWLRILTFHPSSNTVSVQTYSPFLNQNLTDAANQFTVYYHDPAIHTGSGQITGRVTGLSCAPLAGATVSAGSASTTTDSQGHFSLNVAAPSSYSVSVNAPGWPPATRSVKVNDNYATDSDFLLCLLNTANQTVTICSPGNSQTVTSPVHVVAGSTDTTAAVVRMEIWLDGVKVYTTLTNTMDTTLAVSAGSHRIAVTAAEASGFYFKQAVNVNVVSSTAPTVQLSANPSSITAGQSSTLSWSSTNATSVTISGVGTFGPSGSVSVSPGATTTYTATATGSSGSATSSTTVTVQSASFSCTPSSTNHTVTICSPANGATVSSPVHVVASSTDTTGTVIRMEIWLDGVKVYTTFTNSMDTMVPMSSGTHRLVVVAAESSTSYFSAVESITVSP
ncbi:MAG: carboxypeptidase regulatory-like domain-containing protein [Terriglobales bacterium]